MTEQPGAVAPPANNFLAYLRAFGPGIVVALSWVGTGDLIDNSVAGGNYGYVASTGTAGRRTSGSGSPPCSSRSRPRRGIGKAVGELLS